MRKLPAILIAGTIVVLAGTAVAANHNSHVMSIQLPDGSTARVEYVGDVAPKVIIEPSRAIAWSDRAPIPSFAGFDRMFEQLNREADAMLSVVRQAGTQPNPGAVAPFVASSVSAPAGATTTTIVSYSNGASTCTRTTETVSQGPGKRPTVRSTVSGNCGSESARPAPVPPQLSHT